MKRTIPSHWLGGFQQPEAMYWRMALGTDDGWACCCWDFLAIGHRETRPVCRLTRIRAALVVSVGEATWGSAGGLHGSLGLLGM